MHGLVRCTHWVQVFTLARGGCDSHRCHNKTPRKKMGLGMWMTSCLEATGWGFWDLKKKGVSWDSTLKEGSWFSGARRGQTSSLQRGATRGGIRWKSQHRKKLCLSLLVSKNLKLKKVIKSFVPEPRKSSSVSSVFGFLYAYEHYERCIHMYITRIRILVVFLDVDMLHSYPVKPSLVFFLFHYAAFASYVIHLFISLTT